MIRWSGVLRHRDFRNLWLGQAISQFGDACYALIFLFMVQKLTGSNALVGYVGALQALPFVILGPYAGAVADRIDRRTLMLAADLCSTVLLGGFALCLVMQRQPPIWTLLVVPTLLSCINVFFFPAKTSSIPRLVPAEELVQANALSAATQSMMPLIGLGLSLAGLGPIYATYPDLFFLIAVCVNGLTFLASAVFIWRLPKIEPQREATTLRRPLAEAVEGIRYLWRQHVLKVVLVLTALVNLSVAPFMVVYIAANDEWFGGRFATLAAFELAFVIGMVVGSLLAGRVRIVRPGLAYVWGLFGCAVCLLLMALSPMFWLFAFWNFAAGITLPFASIPIQTYFQLVVPDEFRGRAASAMTMAAQAVSPVGQALAGVILVAVGIYWMFILMGAALAAFALLGLADGAFRTCRLPAHESARDGMEPQEEPVVTPRGP